MHPRPHSWDRGRGFRLGMRRTLTWLTLAFLSGASASSTAAGTVLHGAHLDYVMHCQGCHLEDGRATTDVVPALMGSVGSFMGVPGGREYMVRVPGSANAPISDARLAELLNWMVERFGGQQTPRNWRRYTTEEVAQQRYLPLLDLEANRAELLRAARLKSIASTGR